MDENGLHGNPLANEGIIPRLLRIYKEVRSFDQDIVTNLAYEDNWMERQYLMQLSPILLEKL